MEVIFFREKSGREPIAEFLDGLPEKPLGKIFRDIETLAKHPHDLREPYAKHLEGSLWELRTRFSTNVYRIIYCIRDEKIILLHGFVKKTQKTPLRDLEIARRRYKELT